MADIIGHPWMQGECATPEEIAQDFAERRVQVQAPNPEEMQIKNKGEGATRRGAVTVGEYVFVSGGLTEQERANPKVVSPALKAHTASKNSNASIFTDFPPEEVFRCLIKQIYDENTTYNAGPNKWRFSYTMTKMFAGSLDEEELPSFEDAAKI